MKRLAEARVIAQFTAQLASQAWRCLEYDQGTERCARNVENDDSSNAARLSSNFTQTAAVHPAVASMIIENGR